MRGFEDSGLAVPEFSALRRVRLNTARATRAWRKLARELELATEALARAHEIARAELPADASNVIAFPARDAARFDEAVQRYHEIALRILCTPTDRVEDLRQRLALVALMLGRSNPIGALGRVVVSDFGDLALALLDMELCRISHGWAKEPRRTPRRARRRKLPTVEEPPSRTAPSSLAQPGGG